MYSVWSLYSIQVLLCILVLYWCTLFKYRNPNATNLDRCLWLHEILNLFFFPYRCTLFRYRTPNATNIAICLWFCGVLIDWLTNWPRGWLADWLADCLIDWLTDWLISLRHFSCFARLQEQGLKPVDRGRTSKCFTCVVCSLLTFISHHKTFSFLFIYY